MYAIATFAWVVLDAASAENGAEKASVIVSIGVSFILDVAQGCYF